MPASSSVLPAAATTSIFDSHNPYLYDRSEHRATESAHRRVELQSPLDLQFLIANVQRAAREKLDKHFPPDATPAGKRGEEEDDGLKRRVEELVDQYIRDTFHAAKDGVSINGMTASELETEVARAQEGEEIEPHDTKLVQRIQSLSSQIESHTLALANLRRTAPAETARRVEQRMAREAEQDELRMRMEEERRRELAAGVKVEAPEVPRWDEVQRSWVKGAQDLAGLKTGLGRTVAKMERAKSAVEVVEGR